MRKTLRSPRNTLRRKVPRENTVVQKENNGSDPVFQAHEQFSGSGNPNLNNQSVPNTIGNEPSLPHERDESADHQDKQSGESHKISKQAYEDVSNGLIDTGKKPVLEQLGNKMRSKEN